MNTCVCVYVDYAWTYVPKHTCSCKSMDKFVTSMGNFVSMSVDIYLFM